MFNVLENLLSLHWVFHLRQYFLLSRLFCFVTIYQNNALHFCLFRKYDNLQLRKAISEDFLNYVPSCFL